MSGSPIRAADIKRLMKARQQIEPLGDRLQHAELDTIMHELDEMAAAGRTGMDEAR